MIVRKEDGACRSCGGQLDIIDFDDASMTVVCSECSDSYDVETDAFGDGCMTYYFALTAKRILGEDDDGPAPDPA